MTSCYEGRRKRSTAPYLLSAIVVVAIIGVGVLRYIPGTYERHFDEPLPPGSQLTHHAHHRAGWNDMTYGFEFTVDDNALRDRLIERWHLKPAGQTKSEVANHISPPWWPTDDRLTQMNCFQRLDDDNEDFKTVWSDETNGRLYVEYGNW